jgi:hypothetical protein
VISGGKIKVVGDNSKVGITCSGTDSGGAAFSVPFSGNYAENAPGKIIAILPGSLPEGEFVIRITTQFTSGDTFLKEPRVVSSCAFNAA